MKFLLIAMLFVATWVSLLSIACADSDIMQEAVQIQDSGDIAGAIRIYKSLVDARGPDYERALYKIGEAYSLLDQSEEAEVWLHRFLLEYKESDLTDYAYYWMGGSLLWRDQPEFDRAVKHFQYVVAHSRRPDLLTQARYSLGECYFQMELWEEAAREFRTVSDDPAASNAVREEARKRLERAASKAEDAYEPDDIFRRAMRLRQEGHSREAAPLFAEIADNYHRSAYHETATLMAAEMYSHSHQYDESYRYLRRYRDRGYTDDTGFFNLLMGHALRGKADPDYREAIEWYTKVYVQGKPEQEMDTARFRIAECYHLMGQLARARDEYKEFIRRFPESHWVGSAESKLGRVLREIEKDSQPDYVTVEGHYQYAIEKDEGDGPTIRIRNIQEALMLARDSGGYPHAFVVPVNLSDVDPGLRITFVVESFPAMLGPIAYLEVVTEAKVEGILPSGASLGLWLEQGDNSLSGTNRIVKQELAGVWGGSLYSANTDYAKPITIRVDVHSLGKDLLGFGRKLSGGELMIALVVADPGGVGFKTLNEARTKAEYLKYISVLYELVP